MFLACVEIAACSPHLSLESKVLELEFDDFELARGWAVEESKRRGDATGNAAVFQTAGPLMVLAWECPDSHHRKGIDERLPQQTEADRGLISA